MTPDRRKRALDLLQSALELPPARRDEFLAKACAGDAALRGEVESLIASHDKAGSFLESPAIAPAAEPETEVRPAPLVGQRLGPYAVLRLLGRGGMGEVYLAEDSRLSRKVALKLLRSERAQDVERLKRFEREASAVSALNHPNILTLYEMGEDAPHRFMATEFVEGETLRQILSRRKASLGEALEIAIQVASALAAAHQAGVVHRDIKPENVMLRPDGYVKVLDFGLAKLTEPRVSAFESARFGGAATETGMVMGTFRYMSPEQARGLAVDERTDVFSLGVVLYEMVAGRPPFDGPTASDVLVALLEKEPAPFGRADGGLPPSLEQIVFRALRKAPSERYATMTEMLQALRAVKRQLDTGAPLGPVAETARRAGARRSAMIAGLALALVLAAAVFYITSRPRQPERLGLTFRQLTTQWGRELHPSISPDGKWILYVSDASGNDDIYLQAVGGQTPINLTQNSPASDREPAFSPDGERIAFRSDRQGGGVFVMGRTGESPRRLADSGFNPAWSPDGEDVVFSTRSFVPNLAAMTPGELWAVNATTGEKRKLFGGDAAQPHWSPGGHRVAFCGKVEEQRGWLIQTVPAGSVEGAEAVPVTDGAALDWNPVWSPDGRHLYFISDRGGSMNLWRVPIDEISGRALGEPEPLTTPSPHVSHLSVSADGKRIAYATRERRTNLQGVGFDPVSATVQGEPTLLTSGSQEVSVFAASSEWVAYTIVGRTGISLIRLDGTGGRELTTFPSSAPFFSADGSSIVFHSPRSGRTDLWRIRLDGTGLEQITDAKQDGVPGYVHAVHSTDGSRMAFHTVQMKPGRAVMIDLAAGRSGTPHPLPPLTTGGEFFDPWSWSPDGERLAGSAIEAFFKQGHYGIVIYSFKTRRYEKLTDFGESPFWLTDGRRLVFASEGKLYVVDSVSRKTWLVFALPPPATMKWPQLAADGRHVVFMRSIDEADVWMAELN